MMVRHRLLAASLAALLWAGAGPAWTRQDSGADTQPAKKAKKPDRPARAPVIAPGGSGETAAERSARLRRECKGRPNAGACTGYTD